jgi:environmental stress-induced protein Ves
MLLTIKTPDQFKHVPWKNGKGVTQELAINEGANIDNFIWRISMANVVEDGPFSNFTGYTRHLLLLEGSGIDLAFDGSTVSLNHTLAMAEFDGGMTTHGKLHNGPIRDFNVIFNPRCCTIQTQSIQTNTATVEHTLPAAHRYFIYAAHSTVSINVEGKRHTVEQGCFAELTDDEHPISIQSAGCIAISLTLN